MNTTVNLEEELRIARRNLQELQAANEKLLAANAELSRNGETESALNQTQQLLLDIPEYKQMEQLNQEINLIDKHIHSTLPPDGIIRRILAQASDAIGAETAVICLRKEHDWIISHVHGLAASLVGTKISDSEERHVFWAIRTKKTVAINNVLTDDRANQEHMKKWSMRSVLVSPMIIRGEPMGVVYFNYHQSAISFQSCHTHFASQLSGKLSLALENARLFENLEKELAERKKAEQKLYRLNRTLKALSDSNLAMVRATSERHYLDEVCRIVVQDCGHVMVWIGFAEDNEARRIRPVANAGLVDGYLETLNITWGEKELGYGPVGTAVRDRKPCHCRNIRTDLNFAPWRQQALKRGYASVLSVPLTDGQKAFGVITIYSTQPDAFSDDEVRLLTEFGSDLSRGITDLRLRVAHTQAQEALKVSEQRVRMKLDSILSPEGDIGTLELADILDAQEMQSFMTDFYELAHIPISVVDLQGKVLVGVGWQEICTKFHRVHPETNKLCAQSNAHLSANVVAGKFNLFKCNNNMWKAATPIIVAGHHMGNLLSGQFFFSDETLNFDSFRAQARKYGFDELAYLHALEKVPRLTRGALSTAMDFFMKLAHFISKLSFSNIKLARTLTERNHLMESLSAAKKQLEKANQELEQRVQERTAKLHEAVGELEHFSYTITHDMRAPLRAMRGYGDILLEQNSSMTPESKQFIARINSAAGRMDNLITDALHYSKLVRQEVNLSPINCEELLWEMINGYPQYQEVKSSISIEGKIPAIQGNEAALIQCFSNVLNNAIKFVEPGKQPRVRIWAEEKGERVRIWFCDNGIGVPKECHEQIFVMFQRVNPKYEGTGIGLALVRKAAERMGGKAGVDSTPGKGSNFWLEFNKPPQISEQKKT